MNEKYSLAEKKELAEFIIKYKEDYEEEKIQKATLTMIINGKTRTDETKTMFPCYCSWIVLY